MSVRRLTDTAAPDDHVVDQGWRQDRAVALESEARVIVGCLLELANVEKLFAARRNDKTCTEIRQLAGRLTSST
jgi:hypothetical protein